MIILTRRLIPPKSERRSFVRETSRAEGAELLAGEGDGLHFTPSTDDDEGASAWEDDR